MEKYEKESDADLRMRSSLQPEGTVGTAEYTLEGDGIPDGLSEEDLLGIVWTKYQSKSKRRRREDLFGESSLD